MLNTIQTISKHLNSPEQFRNATDFAVSPTHVTTNGTNTNVGMSLPFICTTTLVIH